MANGGRPTPKRMANGGRPTPKRIANGGRTRPQPRKMRNGGRLNSNSSWGQFKNSPCPNSVHHPDYTFFVETAMLADGAPLYFCCAEKSRTERCNKFEPQTDISNLVLATVPNAS